MHIKPNTQRLQNILKEIKKTQINGKTSCVHRLGLNIGKYCLNIINIVKMSILPKVIDGVNAIISKFQ